MGVAGRLPADDFILDVPQDEQRVTFHRVAPSSAAWRRDGDVNRWHSGSAILRRLDRLPVQLRQEHGADLAGAAADDTEAGRCAQPFATKRIFRHCGDIDLVVDTGAAAEPAGAAAVP